MPIRTPVTTPILEAEFSALITPMRLVAGEAVAVAVSGGADSLALAILIGEWCRVHDISLTALTVDHGLRPAAAEEARQVARWLEKYHIPHVTLCWQGDKPHSNIQDRARQARYDLMGAWCVDHNVGRLFLAHHRDDQAETFLIRLFRGSGIDGLSAMKAKSEFPYALAGTGRVTICRPLLGVVKARLEATLRHRDQPWVADPSNHDEGYTRVKVRNLLQQNDIEGLDGGRMADTAARMGRVQSLLQALTVDLMQDSVTFFPEGYGTVSLSALLSGHEEIALRCLATILRRIGGGDYNPRLARLEALYDRLKSATFKGQTLAGCLVSPLKDNHILISREVAAIDDDRMLDGNRVTLWDGRFTVENKAVSGRLKKLEAPEWQRLCRENPALKKLKMRKVIRDSLPCIVKEDGSVTLPDFLANFLADFIPGIAEKGFSARWQQHFVKNLGVKSRK